jgi:hypothetical protein
MKSSTVGIRSLNRPGNAVNPKRRPDASKDRNVDNHRPKATAAGRFREGAVMQGYRLTTSTAAMGGLAAACATVATLAVAVLLPARMMPNTDPHAPSASAPSAIEIAIVPSRVDVIGFRSTKAKSAADAAAMTLAA